MILTGKEIQNQVNAGNIVIEPFILDNLNPNSYNYCMGTHYKEKYWSDSGVDQFSELMEIPHQGLILKPKRLYLSSTAEIIGSRRYVVSLMGRSSIGRLGLFVQLSADLGNLGEAHRWTLELTCIQPITVYPNMVLGQVSFWMPKGEIELYKGKYHSFNSPKESIYASRR